MIRRSRFCHHNGRAHWDINGRRSLPRVGSPVHCPVCGQAPLDFELSAVTVILRAATPTPGFAKPTEACQHPRSTDTATRCPAECKVQLPRCSRLHLDGRDRSRRHGSRIQSTPGKSWPARRPQNDPGDCGSLSRRIKSIQDRGGIGRPAPHHPNIVQVHEIGSGASGPVSGHGICLWWHPEPASRRDATAGPRGCHGDPYPGARRPGRP